ncbi:hypothetical protein [Candidatus Tisiphia endosymbiont of Ptychoptera albimana]
MGIKASRVQNNNKNSTTAMVQISPSTPRNDVEEFCVYLPAH